MTSVIEKNPLKRDHYKATLEEGSLTMTPYCACGNVLNEDYFCEQCNRRCHCFQIVCDNSATLELVQKYIYKSHQFAAFKASLAKGN